MKACCAPRTSLFSRLIRAPVWVRVKKARGMLWMWRNTFERMSKINPSPMTAEMRRSVRERMASKSASPPARQASPMTRSASCCPIPLSIRARRISGLMAATAASRTTTGRNTARILL